MNAMPDIRDRFSTIQAIIKQISPDMAEFTKGIKNAKDQALVLQAALLGLQIPENILKRLGAGPDFEERKNGIDPRKGPREYIKKMVKDAKAAQTELNKLLGVDDSGGGSGTGNKDALNAKLKLISEKEDEINKKYDARKKALEQINKIQEQISQQQKQQLDLADAISRGDIGAAAKAAQEMRATSAANQLEAQGTALDVQRQRAIAGIRVGGLSKAEIEKKVATMSTGGMVPSYFAMGGLSKGTDTVPAMLTPGEFVIRKSAVDRIGVGTLSKINGYASGGQVQDGTLGNSMYNSYSINLSINSNSDANDIANKVLETIRRVESQNIRSNRF
jgi:hypothetical protein